MDKKDLLPIGSVVLLKNAVKRLMIMGYAQQEKKENDTENNSKIWDYCGTLFPEGFISSDNIFLFDHDQIDKLFYSGYVDSEQAEFVSKVNDIINGVSDKEKDKKGDNNISFNLNNDK